MEIAKYKENENYTENYSNYLIKFKIIKEENPNNPFNGIKTVEEINIEVTFHFIRELNKQGNINNIKKKLK